MARPRTKGEPVMFRPPVHLYQLLEDLADEAGITPSAYVERLTLEYLGRIADERTPNHTAYIGSL